MLCPPWFPSEANPGTILGQAFGQRCDARGENAISLEFLEVGSTTVDMAPVDLGMGFLTLETWWTRYETCSLLMFIPPKSGIFVSIIWIGFDPSIRRDISSTQIGDPCHMIHWQFLRTALLKDFAQTTDVRQYAVDHPCEPVSIIDKWEEGLDPS